MERGREKVREMEEGGTPYFFLEPLVSDKFLQEGLGILVCELSLQCWHCTQ